MTARPDSDPVVRIYPSRLKIGVLVLPCILAIAITLQADNVGEPALADMTGGQIAAILIALAVAGLLLHMAFEREPVLQLDADGIHCRRPPIGCIAWPAITAVAVGRVTLQRQVLMIAANPNLLDPEARAFAQRSSGLAHMLSRQLVQFAAQAKGSACFFIPVSMLSMRAGRIEAHVDAFAARYAALEEDRHA